MQQMERVHTYGRPATGRGRRDPQLVADPAKLPYGDDLDAYGAYGAVPSSRAANHGYGAVNPNIVYPGSHSHHVYVSEPVVVREQYCLCAPKTDAERRLLVTVLVLGVICLLLTAAVATLVPVLRCGHECDEKDGVNTFPDLIPFMQTRLGNLFGA